MKILVADDDPVMRRIIELRLKKDGHQVTIVADGREAMEHIARNENFDLIITDIMMPFSSGLEIVGKVKSNVERKTPVIVLSSMGQENIVLEAFNLGADDYITKPFSPNELSMRVKRLAVTAHII
jgi:DNA-binding response OmpR family regulator